MKHNPDSRTDAELIHASRRDNTPFGILFDRHAPAIYRWLRSHIDSEETCRDLTAETFATAWEQRTRFRKSQSDDAKPWLQGIAHNLYRMWARSQGIEVRAMRRLGMPIQTHELDVDLDRISSDHAVSGGMMLLTKPERTAVTLRVIDELSYSEVASRMNCSRAAARMRVMRGLRTLRRHATMEDEQ